MRGPAQAPLKRQPPGVWPGSCGACPLLGGVDQGNGECSYRAPAGYNTLRTEVELLNQAEGTF